MGIIVLWILFALLATAIGSSRGRPGYGLFLGIFLGPIGCLFAAVAARPRQTPYVRTVPPGAEWTSCPECGAAVLSSDNTCWHCGYSCEKGDDGPGLDAPSADPESRLRQLKELLDKGLISDEEYREARARTLADV